MATLTFTRDDYFDMICSKCNCRRGIHWSNTCPDKYGARVKTQAVFFLDSGKVRTQKCDANRNPYRYKRN